MASEHGNAEFVGSLVVVDASTRMLDVVEFGDFGKDARNLLDETQINDLCNELATLRQLGNVIKDTNGLRKFRWGAKGKGKRGGVRVVYYYGGDHMPIFLISIYSKSEKADMTNPEKKAARKLIEALKKEYRSKKCQPQLRVVSVQRKEGGSHGTEKQDHHGSQGRSTFCAWRPFERPCSQG